MSRIVFDIPDDPAACARLAAAFSAASDYCEDQRDRSPLRSQDPDTARYAWGDLSGLFASALLKASARPGDLGLVDDKFPASLADMGAVAGPDGQPL